MWYNFGMKKKAKRFAKYYARSGNAFEAAKRAGYRGDHKRVGYEALFLLNDPEVMDLVKQYRIEYRVNDTAKKFEVLVGFQTIYDNCIEKTEDGGMRNVNGAIKALENIAKLQGLYDDKNNVTGSVGGNIEVKLVLDEPDADS